MPCLLVCPVGKPVGKLQVMFRGTGLCPGSAYTLPWVCPVDKLHMPCLLVCPVGKLQVMFRGTVFCPTMVVLAPHALFIGVSGREAPSHV